MKTIFKFPLKLAATQSIIINREHKFLCAQMQNEVPTLWAEVDTETENVQRLIYIVGTGHERRAGTYIGTIQMGQYVWHIYEAPI